MPFYRAYELTLSSEIELPELPSGEGGGEADVTIVSEPGMPLPDPEQGWIQISPAVWSAPQKIHLAVPGVARFTIREGSEIRVYPAPGIDDASVRVFLLGSAIGALLFQRGFLVLHGNAVVVNGRVMICLGPSGAGKSTLAAAFAARGYPVLADDVVAINDAGEALPGIPRIKLWQDAATRLDIDTADLMRIRPAQDKFNLALPARIAQSAVPVRWIYLLEQGDDDRIELTPVSGLARFQPLLANTYRRQFMEGMSGQQMHLARCGKLAEQVHMAYVQRPKAGFDIDALVARLLTDMSGSVPEDHGAVAHADRA